MKQEDFNKLSIDELCILIHNHPKVLRAEVLSIDDEPKLLKQIYTSHDVDEYLANISEDDYDNYLN